MFSKTFVNKISPDVSISAEWYFFYQKLEMGFDTEVRL